MKPINQRKKLTRTSNFLFAYNVQAKRCWALSPIAVLAFVLRFFFLNFFKSFIMQSKKLQAKLRQIILENEGDRDDIYSDVLTLITPLVDVLTDMLEPSGAYSKDPLTHANNVIKNCSSIAKETLDDLFHSIA